MPITADQLEILYDMFEMCDKDWLMEKIDIQKTALRKFVIEFDDVNEQDIDALFG